MSIVHSCPDGWIISHEEFIKNVYENVSDGGNEISLRLNSTLFKIVCPYRSNKNNKKNINESSKRKRKTNSKSNFDNLKLEIDHVAERFQSLINEVDLSVIFNKYSGEHENNKEALDLADTCLNVDNLLNSSGSNTDQSITQMINGRKFLFPQDCRFFSKDVVEIEKTFCDEIFDVILLDPPWWNKYIRRKNAKSNQGYQMMYNFDLTAIPVQKLLAPNGLVVVWCTNAPQNICDLEEKILPFWGLKKIAKWYWLKVTHSCEPICEFTDPPGKQPFEQIIFAARDNIDIPNGKLVVSIPSALHSHKPPLSDLLSIYMKDTKCLEIFARYLLPGWTSWGLEVTKLQQEILYERS